MRNKLPNPTGPVEGTTRTPFIVRETFGNETPCLFGSFRMLDEAIAAMLEGSFDCSIPVLCTCKLEIFDFNRPEVVLVEGSYFADGPNQIFLGVKRLDQPGSPTVYYEGVMRGDGQRRVAKPVKNVVGPHVWDDLPENTNDSTPFAPCPDVTAVEVAQLACQIATVRKEIQPMLFVNAAVELLTEAAKLLDQRKAADKLQRIASRKMAPQQNAKNGPVTSGGVR